LRRVSAERPLASLGATKKGSGRQKRRLGATKRWARDELIVNPQPETVLKEGDLLVLSGSEPKINRALYYLESPYEGMY
jgi:hypothetical protein